MTLKQQLRAAIDAIAKGECEPTLDELEALLVLCDNFELSEQAARVRRWLDEPPLRRLESRPQ